MKLKSGISTLIAIGLVLSGSVQAQVTGNSSGYGLGVEIDASAGLVVTPIFLDPVPVGPVVLPLDVIVPSPLVQVLYPAEDFEQGQGGFVNSSAQLSLSALGITAEAALVATSSTFSASALTDENASQFGTLLARGTGGVEDLDLDLVNLSITPGFPGVPLLSISAGESTGVLSSQTDVFITGGGLFDGDQQSTIANLSLSFFGATDITLFDFLVANGAVGLTLDDDIITAPANTAVSVNLATGIGTPPAGITLSGTLILTLNKQEGLVDPNTGGSLTTTALEIQLTGLEIGTGIDTDLLDVDLGVDADLTVELGVSQAALVPEPATVALVGFGLAGLAIARLKRKTAS